MRITKRWLPLLLLLGWTVQTATAQQPVKRQNARPELRKGNELYKQKKYKEAQEAYAAALQKDPASYTGMFNIGDALYNTKQYDNARMALGASAKATKDKKEQARAYHNIGNTFMQEQKWEEAINAYKQSLRLNPEDADTKYNLAYANAMLKKNGGKDKNKDNKDNKDKDDKDKKDNKDQNKDNKDQDKKDQDKKDGDKKEQDKKDGDQDKKQDQGDKDKKEEQRPQGQPSKLSQQQAENLLNALRQEEKKLQDKKEKGKAVPIKLEKDW